MPVPEAPPSSRCLDFKWPSPLDLLPERVDAGSELSWPTSTSWSRSSFVLLCRRSGPIVLRFVFAIFLGCLPTAPCCAIRGAAWMVTPRAFFGALVAIADVPRLWAFVMDTDSLMSSEPVYDTASDTVLWSLTARLRFRAAARVSTPTPLPSIPALR